MPDKATKISFRFYRDRMVRTVWDEDGARWWFSFIDVVAALNAQNDYAKARNYWKYLKNKLRKENPQLVSATNRLKLKAADGKKYLTHIAQSCPSKLKHLACLIMLNHAQSCLSELSQTHAFLNPQHSTLNTI